MLTLLSPADYRRIPWKNRQGWTTELATRPATDGFDWRVSIADVVADCEFSRFPGIDRSILVLSGDGMELQVDAEPARMLRAGNEPFAFSGDATSRARLFGGPTRDFNVMTRRSRFRHVLGTRKLGEPLSLERPAGCTWLIHVLHGRVKAAGVDAVAGESILSESADSTGVPLDVRGHGVVVLVHLVPGKS